jgi:hypothetical protein
MELFSLVAAAIFTLVNLLVGLVCLVWAVYGAKRGLDASDKCCEGQQSEMLGTGCVCSALTVTLMYLCLIGML